MSCRCRVRVGCQWVSSVGAEREGRAVCGRICAVGGPAVRSQFCCLAGCQVVCVPSCVSSVRCVTTAGGRFGVCVWCKSTVVAVESVGGDSGACGLDGLCAAGLRSLGRLVPWGLRRSCSSQRGCASPYGRPVNRRRAYPKSTDTRQSLLLIWLADSFPAVTAGRVALGTTACAESWPSVPVRISQALGQTFHSEPVPCKIFQNKKLLVSELLAMTIARCELLVMGRYHHPQNSLCSP